MIKRYPAVSLKKINDAPEANGKMPSHILVGATADFKEKVDVGTLWLKKGEYGNYLSGTMKTPRTADSGVAYKGYSIVDTEELDALEAKLNSLLQKSPEKVQSIDEVAKEFKNGEVKIEDLPF